MSDSYEMLEWLVRLAWHIDALVHSPSGMSRFRDMVRQWTVEDKNRRAEVERLAQRRRDHEAAIRENPRLRDEDAGPPKLGWVWEEFPRLERLSGRFPCYSEYNEVKELAVVRTVGVSVAGWTPPELAWKNWPNDDRPLPLPEIDDQAPDREFTLADKYAALAAIHDFVCKGAAKIDPWHEKRAAWSRKEVPPGMAYCSLVEQVPKVQATDEEAIAAFLRCVVDDLRVHAEFGEALSFAGWPATWPTAPARPDALDESGKALDELVTLSQAAPLVGLSKRTLERYVTCGKLPEPDVPGGGGKAHKWRWRSLRTALQNVAKRILPERFPGSRII